jgi:hypothetical protein
MLSDRRRAIVLRIVESGTVCDTPGVTLTAGTGRAGALAEAVVAAPRAGVADGTKASTSRFTMRPPGPEPGMLAIS